MSYLSNIEKSKNSRLQKADAKKILLPKKERYTKKTFLRIFTYSTLISLFIMLVTVISLYYSFKSIVKVETYKKSYKLLNQSKSIFESLHSWIIPSFFQIKSEGLINYLIYSKNEDTILFSNSSRNLGDFLSYLNSKS